MKTQIQEIASVLPKVCFVESCKKSQHGQMSYIGIFRGKYLCWIFKNILLYNYIAFIIMPACCCKHYNESITAYLSN